MGVNIIALTGPQGTGKTTLMNSIFNKLSKRYKIQCGYITNNNKSISREAFDFGFEINEKTTFDTQYYIGLRYLASDIATRKHAQKKDMRFIIYDRSVLDVIPYTNASPNIPEDYKKFIERMILQHVQKYRIHKLVYLEPLDLLKEDAYRSNNKEFQEEINYEFLELIQNHDFYKIPKTTIEERTEKLFSIIFDENSES